MTHIQTILRPTVYLITGYARAGKDTLGNAIIDLHTTGRSRRHAFADLLKDAANAAYSRAGLNSVDMHTEADKVRNRDLLVAMGKSMRSINVNVFADSCADYARYAILSGRSCIIPDWRYANEYRCVVDTVAPANVITIKIGCQGIGPANEEEDKQMQILEAECFIGYEATFKPGEIGAIKDWAHEIVSTVPRVPLV